MPEQDAPQQTVTRHIYLPIPRIITVFGDISEESHAYLAQELLKFEAESNDTIFLHINSAGGSAYEMFGIVDLLLALKSPLVTICTGKIMSAGVPILACGEKGNRRIGRNTTVMLHEVSHGTGGKVYETKNDVAEAERLEKLYIQTLAELTNTSVAKFKKIFNTHKDTYLTSEQAIKLGIADVIIG